jgi:hypothetical protein
MQNWEKLGLIYQNETSEYTHSSVPIAFSRMADNIYEIYYSARNKQNQSVPFSLSFDLKSLRVQNIGSAPLLLPGNPGEFDADGVMPTCLVQFQDLLYMFYIGWNRGTDVPFRNALGIATSDDHGKTFSKLFKGPILDRSIYDPCFVASCDVLRDEKGFKMWYLSALKWEKMRDQWKHYYHIKTASSMNLLSWNRAGHVAIDFVGSEYAISSPRVLKINSGLYQMWYSYRGGVKNPAYRIGYAESIDGLMWTRKDDQILLPLGKEWDSEMICYPFIFEYDNRLYMLYNGNEYGKTGFGIAVLKHE